MKLIIDTSENNLLKYIDHYGMDAFSKLPFALMIDSIISPELDTIYILCDNPEHFRIKSKRVKIVPMSKSNWIQKAVKNKGAFRDYCKRLGYDKVNKECIEKGKQSKNQTIRKRATLAETLLKFKNKK
jgi:hypothetical protein